MIQGIEDIQGISIQNFFNPKSNEMIDASDDNSELCVAETSNNDATFTLTYIIFKKCIMVL